MEATKIKKSAPLKLKPVSGVVKVNLPSCRGFAANDARVHRGCSDVLLRRHGGVVFIHNDHLNTPQLMTDTSQNIVWQAQYDAFGDADITTETVTNNLRFPGQYFDQETGLHYNWFRYYDPEQGRYTQSDFIGLDGGINTYAYVYNNPLKYIDPLGLYPAPWCSKWDIIFGTCPDIGDDIKPEDIPEEWIKQKLKEWEGKSCDALERSCKRLLGPGCYAAGTPCLVPCGYLKKRCDEERDRLKDALSGAGKESKNQCEVKLEREY